MAKKSFKDLTIVSVTGSVDYIQGSIYAIQRSCEELKGAKGLLISPPLPNNIVLPAEIEHQVISPFGYLEYNLFILYQLDFFINTDYCLLVQNDGWVLNGKNWKDEFWEYDYIGGPIPIYYKYQNDSFHQFDTEFYLNHLDLVNDPSWIEPQNGGFSLRSKKLLGMPRKLNLRYVVNIPKADNTSRMTWDAPIHHEDIWLTALHRLSLINSGIRFAPSALAYSFSVESRLLHFQRNIPLDSVMGGHFFGNVKIIGIRSIELTVSNEQIFTSKEHLLEAVKSSNDIILFKRLGYDIQLIFPEGRFKPFWIL